MSTKAKYTPDKYENETVKRQSSTVKINKQIKISERN